MPTDQNRFVESTKATLAKRAGYICSNPACLCLTSGPHSDDAKAVTVGEAAHIRGANPGSARFDPAMKPTERRSITNAIWLCRNCAKLIDSDVHQYTVEFVYQWKRKHEQEIRRRVHGSDWPGYLSTSILSAFEDASPASQQIVVDQPDYWEYLLTVELLRTGLRKTQRHLRDLEQGLCFEPARRLEPSEVVDWFDMKLTNFRRIMTMVTRASTAELNTAWGEPGVAGDALEIKRATDTVIVGCHHLVDWEKDVRFTEGPNGFDKIKNGMAGWTKVVSNKIYALPRRLARIFDDPSAEGKFVIDFEVLPPRNLKKVTRWVVRLARKYA